MMVLGCSRLGYYHGMAVVFPADVMINLPTNGYLIET